MPAFKIIHLGCRVNGGKCSIRLCIATKLSCLCGAIYLLLEVEPQMFSCKAQQVSGSWLAADTSAAEMLLPC